MRHAPKPLSPHFLTFAPHRTQAPTRATTETYHDSDPLTVLISDDYRMLQLISRFGITPGFGEQTVAAACQQAGVDVGTFLTVVNYIKTPGRVYSNDMHKRVYLPALMQYLRNSHSYFVDYRLPQIRRKLISAVDCSASNQIAFLMLKFYDEYAQEVAFHMNYENEHVHPHVQALLEGKLPEEPYAAVAHQTGANHNNIERSLSELKNIIIKYYPGKANPSQLNDVLMDIFIMEEDLLTHCQLEDTLFADCVTRLERDVAEHGAKHAPLHDHPQATQQTGDLSEREQEVIRLVATGLANKEIADKMFIAVNTVMTHRRNISRKTGIHSAAGLTIYAIVHGIINVEDVKL